MANQENTGLSKWVVLSRTIKGTKLAWVMGVLNVFGVQTRIGKTWSPSGPLLLIERGRLDLGNEILNRPLGKVEIDGFSLSVSVDDLPNDCSMFDRADDDNSILAHVIELFDDLASTTKYSAIKVPDPTEVSLPVEPEVVVAEPEVVDVPANNVIPMKSEPEVVTEDEDDDSDSWLIDDENPPTVPEADDNAFEDDEDEEGSADDQLTQMEVADMEVGTEFTHADELLQSQPMTFPKLKDPIIMYDVESSNVSAIGYRLTTKDPSVTTLYIRFKSGQTYRYNPVPLGVAQELLGEAVKVQVGYQEASVGVAYGVMVKEKSEAGDIKCQRLSIEDDRWVDVQPKSARKAEFRAKSSKQS